MNYRRTEEIMKIDSELKIATDKLNIIATMINNLYNKLNMGR